MNMEKNREGTLLPCCKCNPSLNGPQAATFIASLEKTRLVDLCLSDDDSSDGEVFDVSVDSGNGDQKANDKKKVVGVAMYVGLPEKSRYQPLASPSPRLVKSKSVSSIHSFKGTQPWATRLSEEL